MLIVHGAEGVADAPLPPWVKKDLSVAYDAREVTGNVIVSTSLLRDIEANTKTGVVSPQLKALEHDDAKGSCDPVQEMVSRSYTKDLNFSHTEDFGGGLTAAVSLDTGSSASVTGELYYNVYRKKVLKWCVPLWVSPVKIAANGNATMELTGGLTGSLSYAKTWEKLIKSVDLGGFSFFIGPIPVYIGFKIPITAGIELSATATGEIQWTSDATIAASFSGNCSISGCQAQGAYTNSYATVPVLTWGVIGRVYPKAWAQVALRVFLYAEDVAYGQLGVKPKLEGDAWAYVGTTCGDGDGDGVNENVKGLTADLDFQVFANGKVAGLSDTSEQTWDDLWHSSRKHLYFRDFLTDQVDDALNPTFHGASVLEGECARPGVISPYTTMMRPCYPYRDASITFGLLDVGHEVELATQVGAGSTLQTLNFAPTAFGAHTLRMVARTDDHGRNLSSEHTKVVQVNKNCQLPVVEESDR